MLSFAGLSDLLTPVFEEVADSLAPLRRRALEVALLLAEPGEHSPDPRAIGLALLDVLRLLAEQSPIVVALDDVQWLDPSSAGVLQIALRRLGDERVGLLATQRKVPGVAAPFAFGRAFPEDRLERLWLGPLSLGALHHLLQERLELELTRPELARLQETSGGNPFFALELGRELVRTGTRPAAGRALRIPESLHELLGDRLARLPPDTVDVLLIVAALARPTLELVEVALGDPDRTHVLEVLETAVRAGVVHVEDSRVRFAHPLLASICYEQAPMSKRGEIHRALAAAVTDLEERARHLALAAAGPDATVASALDSAAEQAVARGATAAAAELAELAAELTPDDPPLARRRRLQAATFHRLAGGAERSVSILEQLLDDVPPGVERADVLFALASTLHADAGTTIELLDRALVDAVDDDARLTRLLSYRGWIRLFQADVRAGLRDARAALVKAETIGDPRLLASALGHVATAEGRAGEFTPGLLERGVEIETRLELTLGYHESPSIALSRRLVGLGELDGARAILVRIQDSADARGDELLRAQTAGSVCRLEWFAGRWQLALDHGALAAEIRTQIAARHEIGVSGRLQALVQTDLGLVEEARASALAALAMSEAMSDEEWKILSLGVLGRLDFALGNLEAAGGYLRELPGRLRSAGYNDPTMAPLWADAIETLISLGELDRARDYLDQHEQDARKLGSPCATAGAARCRGLLSAAEGDQDLALEALEGSLTALKGYRLPLERGRTLLCLGVVRRQGQQRTAAREALEGALAVFDELGARLWAEKARAELRRISGRRPASEELTETEHRVATLAARGRSNKEIAAELFMGVSTVEGHLSRVYRKLGVRSRSGLGSRLSPRGDVSKAADEAAQT